MSKQRVVLVVSILAAFVAFMDGSIVGVALPAIARGFGGGLSLQQWVVDVYLITLGALMLVAGSLSDLFGRKRILRLGLLGFGAASLLCALAPSGGLLIAARGLQGVAGALLVPSSLALLMANFSGEAEGKAIGTWTAWTGMAYLVGPLLGGVLIDVASWRWAFAINVVPIALTLVLLPRVPEPPRRTTQVHVDWLGAGLCVAGLGGTVYALIEQSHYGWSSGLVMAALVVGLTALFAFVWYEARAAHPMLPLELFGNRNFSVGNLATLAIYGALGVSTFLITIFVQQVGGYSAFASGAALVPVTIIMFFLASKFGALAGRHGPRLFMSVGPLIMALGFVLMLRVGAAVGYWFDLLPAILVFGLGLACTVAPLTAAILGAIPKGESGIASAVNNATARIAGLVAVAAIGVVTGPTLTVDSFHRGSIAVAVALFIGAAISAIGITNKRA
jgi:EmrB/QacA subfamily drug resistance transporter